MQPDIRIAIIEDDPYARDMIAMMFSRDWRTRVVGEFGCRSEFELTGFLSQPANSVDVFIVDTEVPENPAWPMQVAEIITRQPQHPVILYTCTYPRTRMLEEALENGGGYLVKGEIHYAMASAVVAAAKGDFVITPGVRQCLHGSTHLSLPPNTLVLSGVHPVADFTQRESDIVRLGILFNLAQRDIADELVISTNWVAEAISNAYQKLGLHEILSGEVPLDQIFNDPIILEHCQNIMQRGGSKKYAQPGADDERKPVLRKAPWLSTLAFHLLTAPDVNEP